MIPRCVAPLLLLALLIGCGDAGNDAEPVAGIDPAELEQLAQLGYGDWSGKLAPKSLERSGVVVREPDRIDAGFNLYTSLPSRDAHLVDMLGTVVHTWSAASDDDGNPWHHVEMTDEGALFVFRNGPLEKLDWDSRPIWEVPVPIVAHHDLDIGPDGRIYVLGSNLRYVGERRLPIIDDEIVVLDPDGKIADRISFSEVFPEAVSKQKLDEIEAFLQEWELEGEATEAMLTRTGSPIDLFHANSIELLTRAAPGLGPAGSVLVSIRSMSRVAVIDLERRRVTWSWGADELDHPHHARLLPNGRVSVFDNGWFRDGSRVLRVTRKGSITWQFPSEPGPGFYTRRRGAAQHLSNGNVLITESASGRAFEIAPDGAVVWEFLNPQIDLESRRRAQIYRMERIAPERIEPILARASR